MKITMYNFSTRGCAQCGLMHKRILEIISEYKEVIYKHIFLDEYPMYQKKYQLITSPTMVFLVDDDEVFRISGIVDIEVIVKELDGIIWKREYTKSNIYYKK